MICMFFFFNSIFRNYTYHNYQDLFGYTIHFFLLGDCVLLKLNSCYPDISEILMKILANWRWETQWKYKWAEPRQFSLGRSSLIWLHILQYRHSFLPTLLQISQKSKFLIYIVLFEIFGKVGSPSYSRPIFTY